MQDTGMYSGVQVRVGSVRAHGRVNFPELTYCSQRNLDQKSSSMVNLGVSAFARGRLFPWNRAETL